MAALSDPTNYGNEPGLGPLRQGGVSVSQTPDGPKNLPSVKSKVVERQEPALSLVRDLEAGPEMIRNKAMTYLPKAPGESVTSYNSRLGRSVFFNAFMHTVRGLVGFIFRRDPMLGDDVPEIIAQHWENIDNAGTHGDVFVRDLEQDAMAAGHAAIFVEYPKTGGTQNALQEQAIRPYWIPVKKDNIVSFRVANVDGGIVLTQLVLRECVMVEDGEFGEKEQERFRVLYNDNGIVGFRLMEITKENKVFIVDEGLYPTQVEIPVAEIPTSGKRGLFDSDPALLDLAYLNIAHYQIWSDYANSIHKTCVPILVQIGAETQYNDDGTPKTVVVSTDAGFSVPQGGDVKWIAHDGAALDQVRLSLLDLVGQMATMGLAMLSPDKRAAETAEAKRIDKSTSDSALAVSARGLQDGIERALGFHARYLRLPDAGSVTVNRDFENLTLSAQEITALSSLVAQGQLSLETLWERLKEGNVLPDTWDENTERANIEAQAAIDAAKAVEQAKAMAEVAPKPLAA